MFYLFYYLYLFDKYKLFIIVPCVLGICLLCSQNEVFAMESDPYNLAYPARFYNSGEDNYYDNRREEG